ncbi:uncharacterized protein ASCRUDRAFT_141145 [Ascoidea rubescens DSM 1968]|uniref:Transmembrane protein n=1 Tax=Ascoidea rubescens DSM 1968 TaxID=1344418 RepID=A0A1D2VI27_9ASCO|nr:hypothetical protein ASCRUDRAFT_141145 [Ascoidea rubescens DSM 1968]ODV61308.1 hypothetical protein ASCRUDRAFT_141145 [Ascoidea rubescens DSM 1968]
MAGILTSTSKSNLKSNPKPAFLCSKKDFGFGLNSSHLKLQLHLSQQASIYAIHFSFSFFRSPIYTLLHFGVFNKKLTLFFLFVLIYFSCEPIKCLSPLLCMCFFLIPLFLSFFLLLILHFCLYSAHSHHFARTLNILFQLRNQVSIALKTLSVDLILKPDDPKLS